jgi:drug/metabolite transporter (DMT)-like permease
MICGSINEVNGRKKMQTNVNQLGVNTFQYFSGFILSFLILFIIWPNSSYSYTLHLNLSPSTLSAILLAFITFGAYLFYNFALRRIPVGRISIMYPLTGPIGALSAWLVIDAEITFKIFISLGIILIGTVIPYINQKNN